MSRIINLALKDLLQIVRDYQTFMFLLAMPVLFTLMFGFFFNGGSAPSDTRLPVAWLDQDGGSLSPMLLGLLESSEVVRMEPGGAKNQADLEKQVSDEKVTAALVVPPGYSRALVAGEPLQLALIVKPGSLSGRSAQAELEAVVDSFLSAAHTAALAVEYAGPEAGPALFEPTLASALAAWSDPPVRLDITLSGPAPEPVEQEALMPYTHTAPAMMLQFAIAGLLTSAQVIVTERKSRTLQRLMTTNMRRPAILLGHFLAIFAMVLVQFVLLIVFGQLFLDLDYLSQPLATTLVAVAAALSISALGLLIGVLAKSEDQAVIFSLIPMFVFAGLGGAWMPLEFAGETIQAIGHFSPVAWAMDGFQNIIVRGLDVSAAWLPVAALLGYAALFFGLAAWRFRAE